MRIRCGIWRHPNGKPAQIKVKAFFSSFNANLGDFIYFLIDTGAVSSLIGEADAKRLGINYSTLTLLPKDQWATGVGGVSPVYRIKEKCTITFKTDMLNDPKRAYHVESFDHFDVLKIDIQDEETRKLVIANLPSLLGMDLLANFRLIVTSKEAFLEL